jgi:LacI family transcriptional regulator
MATIKDVARLAGVGVGTASRAISGRGAVAPDTLERVQAAVAALQFKPSNLARSLSLKALGMLGVYVPHFEGWFNGPILSGIDEQLRAVHRHMVTASGCGQGNAREQALEGIDFLVQRECDGVLVVSYDLTDDDLIGLQGRCPNLVVLNRRVPGLDDHCFSSDHHLAGQLAAQALLSRGHREIATISGPEEAPDNQARMAGFTQTLRQHGVRIRRTQAVIGDFSLSSGYEAADCLLQASRRGYTAVFSANDQMAVGAIARFTEAGLRVPHDVSVMGYDDSPIAPYSAPALTTVRLPFKDAAANGCRYLLNACYELALPVQRQFPPAVIWRHSVGQGPHAAVDVAPAGSSQATA